MAGQKHNSRVPETYVMPAECRLDPKLCPELIAFLDDHAVDYGSIQRTAWHLINNKAFSSKNELNKYLQERFHIKTRTANSIISDMEGRHKSLLELKKREQEELDVRIARKQGKIDEIKEYLDAMTPQAAKNAIPEGPAMNEYRRMKRALHPQQMNLDRMKNRRSVLEKEIRSEKLSICFGTKALFRKQYELEKSKYEDHAQWLAAFRTSRDKNFYFLARGEETLGNQMCHLTPTHISDDLFQITVLDHDKSSRVGAQGLVRFSYCLPEVQRQLQWHLDDSAFKKPVTARFVKRKQGWYLILSLRVKKMPVYTEDRKHGVVSMDFNCSFLELTELDQCGNLIHKVHLDIPHAGKGDRGRHETRAVVKKAVQYAARVQKPLAVEELDFTKKRARLLKKRAINYNQMLSSLNYGQYKEALSRRCDKDGVELIVVSPAYTSQTGKKYMEAMHLTGHESAAWQIGRRAMGYRLNKEKSSKQKAYEKKAKKDIASRKRRKRKEKAAISAART